ncbi:DUF4190 domain-containing protein [Streptomyces sp. NPDC126499]|uniref:DUF4190 domain-containing protein n=1 Tax=Streptomyces sp. NPDC126499 TaxID=3155314 RepID=UPI00332B3394
MSFSDHPARPNESASQTSPVTGAKRSSGLAIASLVLGVAAILLFWTVFGGIVLGLLALVLGIIGARKARRGDGGHGTMSLIGAVLGALGLLASAVILAIGASILDSDEFKNLEDCVEHAKTQAERDACARDFGTKLND